METGENRKSSFKIPVTLILIIFVLLGGIVGCSQYVSYNNDEVRLVNEFEAQEKKIEMVHDVCWKTIQSKAGIAKEYRASFDSIYSHIMDKRYSHNDGVLFNWIKESNPEFSMELYKDLSMTIEVQRKQFLSSQEKIVDIVREHNNMLDVIPGSWFLSGKKRLEYEVISSSYSKEVMQTRMDDKVDPF